MLVGELIVLPHLFLREAFYVMVFYHKLFSSTHHNYEKTKSKRKYKRGTDTKLTQSSSNMRKGASIKAPLENPFSRCQ